MCKLQVYIYINFVLEVIVSLIQNLGFHLPWFGGKKKRDFLKKFLRALTLFDKILKMCVQLFVE